MQNSDCEQIIDITRAIFRETRTQSPDTFQDVVLELVKTLIPFDTCKWGSGVVIDDGATIHAIHLHNLTDDDMACYLKYQGQDAILAKMIETRDSVVTYDRYEITPRKKFIQLPIYREYCRDRGLEQLISTMVPEPVTNIFSVISFGRHDFRRPFTQREKQLKTIITPVLTEARRQNIFIDLIRRLGRHYHHAAIVDPHGVLREAEPEFARLMQEEWPNWQGPQLPFKPLEVFGADKGGRFDGSRITIRGARLHDLLLLQVEPKTSLSVLTEAEKRVARLLLRGLADKEIAGKLDISPKTVGHHLQSIYRKTNIANRKQAIVELGRRLD